MTISSHSVPGPWPCSPPAKADTRAHPLGRHSSRLITFASAATRLVLSGGPHLCLPMKWGMSAYRGARDQS